MTSLGFLLERAETNLSPSTMCWQISANDRVENRKRKIKDRCLILKELYSSGRLVQTIVDKSVINMSYRTMIYSIKFFCKLS